MNARHWTVAATLLAAAAIQPARAQDDLSTRIAACTREKDDTRRLACFDRAAEEPKQDATPKRLTAKVAGIEKRARGELVFTLDNGQVWAQREVGAYFPVDVGDEVTILAGTLGSHRLLVGSRATAVTRVR
jgi:hypothetical protein